MHLFKNKTKDVKQFLDQIKANKTNRSSSRNSLDKRSIHSQSPQHSYSQYNSQYHPNSLAHPIAPIYQQNTNSCQINSTNRESNSNFRGSIASNHISINTAGYKFGPLQPEHAISQQQRMPHQPNFYQEKNHHHQRPIYQNTQSFSIHPASETTFYDYHQTSQSNKPSYFDPSRSHVQLQASRPPSFNPYHSEVRPSYQHQIGKNFVNDTELQLKNDFQSNFSQKQSSLISDGSKFHQNPNLGPSQLRMSQTRPSHQKASQVKMQDPVTLSTQNLSNKIQTSANQYESQSSKNTSEKAKPFSNKIKNQKLYNSQVSRMSQSMEQICEAQDGLSTQKDSPAKISQFLSKTKYDIEQIQQVSKKDFKNSVRLCLEVKKKNETQNKDELKEQASDKAIRNPQFIDEKPQKSCIKVSENERYRLEKSLHQVDQVHLKLDGILKEAQILMKNIKRSDENFKKMIKTGGIDKMIDLGAAANQSNRMEIQEQPIKMSLREAPLTDKKVKPKMNAKHEREMNEKQTYRKTRNHYEQIEI